MQKIIYKNKQLKSAELRNRQFVQMTEKEQGKMLVSMTTEQRGLQFQCSFITSLLEIADFPEVMLSLDLTYETIGNLLTVIGYEFSAQRGAYDNSTNINILEKSIASYLTWLAANEHNLKIEVTEKRYTDPLQMQWDPLWHGCNIVVCGSLIKEDFLDAIHGQITVTDKKLTIRMRNIIVSYKRITGHDLTADGVDDVQIEFR